MDTMIFLREKVSLFAGVSDENLTVLASASSRRSYNKGQTILFKGETVDGLHIVEAGKAGVFVKPPYKPPVQIAELSEGEVFGETSIVEMGTAGAAVKACENDTLVLMIPQEAFRHVLQQDEAFAVRVNTLINARKAVSITTA